MYVPYYYVAAQPDSDYKFVTVYLILVKLLLYVLVDLSLYFYCDCHITYILPCQRCFFSTEWQFNV